ncbi:MAG TPA: nuclear transport factor 2 family protein [Steroidobacteraceae bacterium]|jgi:steroid delta-isomerase|nr:nuclear transport factor 2 family protein [Steroidobacteraceae bacterium]
MPTEQVMKSALQAYLDAFNSGSAEAVTALYAADATVEDPVGSPPKRGRAEILAFYTHSIATGAKLALDAPIRGSHGNAAAMAFTARIGPISVRVIDVMTFDESGKFTSMRAYFGPGDLIRGS